MLSDRGRTTRLILAATHRHLALVHLLLDAGARINDSDEYHQTPIHVAVRNQHLEMVLLLLARGADPAVRHRRRRSSLYVAIDLGNVDIVIALIKGGAPLDDVGEKLCDAAGLGVNVLELLLQRNVNVASLRTRTGRTPCHVAAVRGDIDVLAKLVEIGGVQWLDVRDESGGTSVHSCVLNTRVEALRWLIGVGAEFDIADTDLSTPLHIACVVDSLECVLLLVAAGADVNAKDSDGSACAHRAIDLNILELLLVAGANANDVCGNSLYEIAVQCGSMPPSDVAQQATRARIASERLDFVRKRAFEVCVGLQSRGLDALQMCEVLVHACGPVAPMVDFHHWWAIATTVKHFNQEI